MYETSLLTVSAKKFGISIGGFSRTTSAAMRLGSTTGDHRVSLCLLACMFRFACGMSLATVICKLLCH